MLKERRIETIEWSRPGLKIAGYLLSVTRQKYRDGVGLTYVIRTIDEVRIVFKGATRLNLALSREDIGRWIEVEYMGEDEMKSVAQGMNRPKCFRVAVDDERTTEASPDDPAGITDEDIPF